MVECTGPDLNGSPAGPALNGPALNGAVFAVASAVASARGSAATISQRDVFAFTWGESWTLMTSIAVGSILPTGSGVGPDDDEEPDASSDAIGRFLAMVG